MLHVDHCRFELLVGTVFNRGIFTVGVDRHNTREGLADALRQ